MMTAKIKFAAAVVAVAVSVGVSVTWAQQGVAPPAETDIVVLDTYGIWRMHATLEPPVLASGETIKLKYLWLNYKTPDPAKDWMTPQFNDQFWNRGPATIACKTALASKLCLRGKFTVTDPAAVKNLPTGQAGLRLSVGYRGGIIVYLNGKELHREHIGQGKTIADGLAGEERTLENLSIPKSLLKRGINVIGLEIVRAPHAQKSDVDVYEANGCEILRARLTSTGTSGLIPNAARPQGLQVWNADVMAYDLDIDFGDRAEPLRPVRITGARNGMFSGKVVVGSTQPIRGLKATPGTFKGQGGTISASNVRIRYGILWGGHFTSGITRFSRFSPYPARAHRLSALSEEPLDEFGVRPFGRWYRQPPKVPGQPKSVPGAVVPVWITVKVPADVKAGIYAGSVKIEVTGEKPVTVPVELHVADYTLPDTQDYRTWVDMIQCPDTLSLEYKVPLWSDEHFKMIAQSFKLIGQTGSRTVYIPLIAHTNLGNEESMVRWVPKARRGEKKGDKYDYDFSIMERYLDVATKNMGKPKLVIFVVWDHYMMPVIDASGDKKMTPRERQRQMAKHLKKIGGSMGQGPMVTMFASRPEGLGVRGNPAMQKTELVMLPSHLDKEASKPLWKPLFDELRSRLKKRGLEEKMMVGIMSDAWPTKEEHQFFAEVTGGVPWVIHSHEGHSPKSNGKRLLYGVSRTGYQAVVWPVSFSDDGTHRGGRDRGKIKSQCGWKRKYLVARFVRISLDRSACTRWRHFVEPSITGDHRGKGRIGADYWNVLRNKKGARVGRAHERYPESNWRNLVIRTSALAPGPTGPVATNQLNAFREGVQECEARITIEQALYDDTLRDKLPQDLVRRCEEYLHARHMTMWLSGSGLQFYYRNPKTKWKINGGYSWEGGFTGHNWFLSSDWQERTAKLYSLAGEVTRKLNGR